MDKKQMMIVGIVCLVICVVCIFVAIERYNANASSVRAINNLQRNSPLGNMGLEVKPAAPQTRRAAMVVAHLRCGFGADPQPDTNTRREFVSDEYQSFGPDSTEPDTP